MSSQVRREQVALACELGHKIIVRSVPSTGDLIAYLEILGTLKIGGLFARGPAGNKVEYVYAYDLRQEADRSQEFIIDNAVFDAQDWAAVGLGLKDVEALKSHFKGALKSLVAYYYARSSDPSASANN